MPTFRFTKRAKRQFAKLDRDVQERIREKLHVLKDNPSIHAVLEPLTDLDPATHRLRMGDYRALLADEGEGVFLILKVGHRREIYRQ